MGKEIYLDVADRKVLATKITYEDLKILYQQFIDKYGRVPVFTMCNEKHNMPCQNQIKKVIKEHGEIYEEFLLQYGVNRLLDVNGVKKTANNITYDDLIILYNQYIEKYNEFPSATKCDIKHNMPYRKIILDILKQNNISVDEFNKQFNIRDKRYKYDNIKIGDIFGRWEVIGTAPSKTTPKGQRIPHWMCRCTCGSGIISDISDNSLKTGNSTSCGCIQRESIEKLKGVIRSKSFYDWCIENNHQDFLDRWDYSKNKSDPKEVSYCSREIFYFLCPCKKHDSSSYSLVAVTAEKIQKKLRCKYCNSFAQRLIDIRGENALELYCDYDKNVDNPWEIEGSSKVNGVWLKCIDTDYHGSYYLTRDEAIRGIGCPYCSHRKVHPKDSFGQYMIDIYGKDTFEKMWDYEKNDVDPFTIAPSVRSQMVWLKCINTNYHPSSLFYPNDIKNKGEGCLCHYCSKNREFIYKYDSLGYLYPEAVKVWSSKNDKTPYDYYPQSNQKVWWKCKEGKHEDYLRSISHSTKYDFRCPECSNERIYSMLQEKVTNYVKEKYKYDMLHEGKCNIVPINPKTNCRLPFDNEIQELKLIIEVHGKQHYEITGFTYLTAKHYGTTVKEELSYQNWKDEYKKKYALDNGYEYLEIPYWTENDESYKILIDNKINEILKKVA
ncbi:MAG: zinc-ribbon domain-containing protein [Coprococcus sp.]